MTRIASLLLVLLALALAACSSLPTAPGFFAWVKAHWTQAATVANVLWADNAANVTRAKFISDLETQGGLSEAAATAAVNALVGITDAKDLIDTSGKLATQIDAAVAAAKK